MRRLLTSKSLVLSTIFFCSLFCTSVKTSAQQNQAPPITPTKTTTDSNDLKNADLAITANVTASELKFEIVPNPKVEFPGQPERITAWEAERKNLPAKVDPGVTYRNIGITLKIVSRFADIDRIVAEALGEIPVSDSTDDNKAASNSILSKESKKVDSTDATKNSAPVKRTSVAKQRRR